MKRTVYDEIIEKISNPDTLAEGLVDLDNQLKLDEADYNKITESNNSLRDVNSKLALRITTPVEVTKETEVITEPNYDDFLQKLADQLKGGN